MTDGAFLLPDFPDIPGLIARLSAKARVGLWQEAQLMVLSLDNIGSKNSFSPNCTLFIGSVENDSNVKIAAMQQKEKILNIQMV